MEGDRKYQIKEMTTRMNNFQTSFILSNGTLKIMLVSHYDGDTFLAEYTKDALEEGLKAILHNP
jgi:hypothetical protein